MDRSSSGIKESGENRAFGVNCPRADATPRCLDTDSPVKVFRHMNPAKIQIVFASFSEIWNVRAESGLNYLSRRKNRLISSMEQDLPPLQSAAEKERKLLMTIMP